MGLPNLSDTKGLTDALEAKAKVANKKRDEDRREALERENAVLECIVEYLLKTSENQEIRVPLDAIGKYVRTGWVTFAMDYGMTTSSVVEDDHLVIRRRKWGLNLHKEDV
jgi:superfamily I DNA/RNA helicase